MKRNELCLCALGFAVAIFQCLLGWRNSDNHNQRRLNNASDVARSTPEPKHNKISIPIKRNMIIDVISIGSKERLLYLEAQRTTFATHKTIRNFFGITEDDDADPNCTAKLNEQGAMLISRWCHVRKWREDQTLMRHWRRPFARARWLAKKDNPAGWMCAQVRPTFGVAKVLALYGASKAHLPDWLVVMDDDSYYNFELFEQYIGKNFDPDEPRAIAGCMVRARVQEENITFPFGGFGTIFSKAAVYNFLRPINCTLESLDGIHPTGFLSNVCQRIRDNKIDEKPLFRDGMSVVDLMKAYAADQPYGEVKSWRRGNCLHSDWVWGYFINYYYISRHVDDKFYANVAHSRLEGYNESEMYTGLQTEWHREHRRICRNKHHRCVTSSHICHYQTPESMADLTERVKKEYASNFR